MGMVERKLGRETGKEACQEEEKDGEQKVGGKEQLCRKDGDKPGS